MEANSNLHNSVNYEPMFVFSFLIYSMVPTMMAFKLAGTTYNGFRTFLDVDTKLLHPDIRHHFSGGFYVHVESLPFLGSNTEDTKASQILRSYQGSPADKQVVVLTWQELIELGRLRFATF